MSTYTILGKTVEFSKAEDNFYKLQSFCWKAIAKAKEQYGSWYEMQMGIANVINNSGAFAKEIMERLVLEPLYLELAKEYQMFGVGKAEYISVCIDISSVGAVREKAAEIYDNIQEQLQDELEERAFNEELRRAGQISFGIGDSLKNAASNAAHGIANSSGNASSREEASKRRTKLYNDVRQPLWDAIKESIVACITNYQSFVNERIPDAIGSNYDRSSSDAYLENAKTIPEKREELIIQAFIACPWNVEVYEYIFEQYSEERRNIISVAESYEIDLTDIINQVLRTEYSTQAKENEELAIEAKIRIYALMKEWGVKDSQVIDEIEFDCLHRLTAGIESADEARCNEMKVELEKYDALDRNKKMYFAKIAERIKGIWAKEDDDKFDKFLKNADILSPNEVQKAKKYVKKKGRTESAKKYEVAFEHCTLENIKKARMYHKINATMPILKYLGWAFLSLAGILFLVLEELSFWAHLFPAIVGIIYQIYIRIIKSEWEFITIGGKVINPVLNLSKEEFEAKCICDVTNQENNSSSPKQDTINNNKK